MKTGIEQISNERVKQIVEKHYTGYYDQKHKDKELLYAALACLTSAIYGNHIGDEDWPETMGKFKKESYQKNLVKAGALIAAELDRIRLS